MKSPWVNSLPRGRRTRVVGCDWHLIPTMLMTLRHDLHCAAFPVKACSMIGWGVTSNNPRGIAVKEHLEGIADKFIVQTVKEGRESVVVRDFISRAVGERSCRVQQ